MKKRIGFIAATFVIFALAITAFAAETVGGQITLTQFLGASREDTKTITISFSGGRSFTVSKDGFFDAADNIILTSTLDPQEMDMSGYGYYITAEKTDDTYTYAFISSSGGVDRYSLAMSRMPYVLYTMDPAAVSRISALLPQDGSVPTASPTVSDWATEAIAQAKQEGWLGNGDFSDDYTQNITREEFCNVAYASLLKCGYNLDHQETNPFTDVASSAVSTLYSAHIITGTSETTFSPDAFLTREEAATVLYRMAKFMEIAIPSLSGDMVYNDDNSISDWAKKGVYAMKKINVMQGTENECFSPQENYTVEQAIVTLVRLYKSR